MRVSHPFLLKPLRLAGTSIAIAALVACSQAPDDPMAAAKAALQDGDRAAALIQLRNAMAAQPDDGEIRLMLGELHMSTGEYKEAALHFRRALELKVASSRVVPLLAEALLNDQQQKLLLDQWAEARLEDAGAQAQLQSTIALAYLSLGQVAKARQYADYALSTAPSSIEPRLANVRVLTQERGTAAGLAAVEAFLEATPSSAEGLSLKGTLLMADPSRYTEAKSTFAAALQVDPRDFQALFSLATLAMGSGELAAAEERLAELRKHWPRSLYGTYLEARLLLLKGRHEEARPLFARLRTTMPANMPLLLAAGINELQLGAPVQAEALIAQALSLQPDSVPARFFLASANLALGRPERALQALGSLVDSPEANPEHLVLAARAHLLNGDARKAAALYERAEKLKPSDTQVQVQLAVAKAETGQSELALRELEAIARRSASTDADLQLVATQLSLGKAEEALAAIDRLETKSPGQASTLELRGRVLLAKGDKAGARTAFAAALQKDPRFFPALAQLTSLDVQEGLAMAAVTRLETLAGVRPPDSRLLTLLATVKATTDAPATEVLALLQQATRADPTDSRAWLALLARQLHGGDFAEAISAAREAAASLPDDPAVLDMVGRIQLRAGEPAQAASTYASLLRTAPRSATGFIGQAATLVVMGRLDEAARVLGRLIELDPDAIEPRSLLADVAMRQGQSSLALAQARELQRRHPGHAAGFRLEGVTEAARNNLEAAAAAFRKGIDKTGAADIPVRLFGSLVKGKRQAEAEHFAREWLSRNPRDTELRAYMAYLAYQRGDDAAAQGLFDTILAIDPRHVEALNNSAMVALRQNQPARALDLANRATALQPNNPALLETLAKAQLANRNPQKAVESMRRAINRSTNPLPLRLALAQLHAQAGDKAAARAELEALVALGRSTPIHAEARRALQGLARE